MTFNPDRFFREAINKPSERDLQHKIGASEFSSPCDRCVAYRVSPQYLKEYNRYWLAATIGTGVHTLIEENISTMHARPDWEHGQVWLECPLEIGELPGYGMIRSTPDCVCVDARHLFDWKTSERTKMKLYKEVVPTLSEPVEDSMLIAEAAARFTLVKYYGQAQTYAWAATRAGMPIDNITIGFIARDGKTDDDLWSWTFEYNEEYALTTWERLCNIWSEVRNGKPIEEFSTSQGCFTHS